MTTQKPATSYILWYSSKSHKKDRYFTGVETVLLGGILPAPKPTWTYSKDESYIFNSESEVGKAKVFCEKCGYEDLKIEPIDNNPIWAPPETVTVN